LRPTPQAGAPSELLVRSAGFAGEVYTGAFSNGGARVWRGTTTNEE
jgi:hypothetical protein